MTQNHYQACAQVRDCVFDTAQRMVVDQIARGADHEKVPDVLVEDDFGSCAGVRAAENNGERVLLLGCLCAPGGGGFALGYLTRGKSEIALLKFGQRGISANRGSRMFGSQDQSDDTRAGNSGKDLGCNSHGLYIKSGELRCKDIDLLDDGRFREKLWSFCHQRRRYFS